MKNKKMCVFIGLMFLLVFVGIGVTSVKSESVDIKTSQGATSDGLIPINFSIYIDGNWNETTDLYDWCSGSGTEEDPWVIEGIHVTNENKSAYISIETAEHFIIRNVMVSEYSKPYGHYTFAGLYIEKGEYGLIENCTFTNCSHGISLYEAKDSIKIKNNMFIGSHNDPITGLGKAILIHEAKGVEITNNDIYNYYDGICVWDAEEIYIDNNRIETSFGCISDTGIYFYGVHDSEITNNDFYGCKFAGHDYDDPFTSGTGDLKISSHNFDDFNCYNIIVYGNRFFDLNGNLIGGESDNTLAFCWMVAFGIGVIVFVCVVIVYKRKK